MRLARFSRLADVGLLVGLALLFGALMGTSLTAPLSVLEEHRIMADAKLEWAGRLEIMRHDLEAFGRVRPVFFLWHFAKLVLFGADPFWHHLTTTLMGVLTAFLLTLALQRAGADRLSALVGALLILLSGAQSALWYQVFSYQETVGMLLLSLGLWALATGATRQRSCAWDVLGLGAVALAGLTKETFILVLPGFLWARVALRAAHGGVGWRGALRGSRGLWVAGSVVMCVELGVVAAVLLSRPADAYAAQAAGLGLNSWAPSRWWPLVTGIDQGGVFALFCGAALAMLWSAWTDAGRRWWWAAGALFLLLWVVPQFVVYSHGMTQRYVLPALVAPAALLALSLAALRRAPQSWMRLAWAAGLCAAVGVLAVGGRRTFQAAYWISAEARATGRLVASIARDAPAGGPLVIVADPATGWGFESVFALPSYLAAAGWRGVTLLAPVDAPAVQLSPVHQALRASVLRSHSILGRPEQARVTGVIFFTEPSDPSQIDWLLTLRPWREVRVVEPTWQLALWPPFLRPSAAIERRAWLAGAPLAHWPPDERRQALVKVQGLRGKVGICSCRAASRVETISGRPMLWLGHGDRGGLACVYWSDAARQVRVRLELIPGRAREAPRRHLRVHNRAASSDPSRSVLKGPARVTLDLRLEAGLNPVLIALDDVPDVPPPAGEPRVLMGLLSDVVVSDGDASDTPPL